MVSNGGMRLRGVATKVVENIKVSYGLKTRLNTECLGS